MSVCDLLHYLDDFFSPADSPPVMEITVPLCERLGLSVAPHKVVGLTMTIVFLGIQIDTVCQQVGLLEDMQKAQEALRNWERDIWHQNTKCNPSFVT